MSAIRVKHTGGNTYQVFIDDQEVTACMGVDYRWHRDDAPYVSIRLIPESVIVEYEDGDRRLTDYPGMGFSISA